MALSRVCLDTCAYSNFKRGHAPVVAAISRARWIGVPAIVLGELRAGFLFGRHTERNESELSAFLADPHVEVLAVEDEGARIYAEIVATLRQAGKPVPTNDVWIAALAAREGATVLTYDGHFEAIARVGVRVFDATAS